jgi:NAD(P)-dependent dehydrogenase (short-subunit alcohol dehydrogenase family)
VKTVIVGASSGLGRCLAKGLSERGAQVALLARRIERLHDAAGEAGNGAVAIACDVTDAESCTSAIDQAAAALGGIDALVYTVGVGTLVKLVDTDAATWRATFDANVIGASLVTAAAIPYLQKSHGAAAYLSSVSASMTPPWPGLGAYIVSKAALDKLIDAWRGEHPDLAFTRVIVGECAGGEGDSMTGFASSFDPELAGEVMPIWLERNYFSGALVEVESLVHMVDSVLRGGASCSIPSVTVAARPPA